LEILSQIADFINAIMQMLNVNYIVSA